MREVSDAASLALAERILVEGYPMPEMQPLSPGDLFGPGLLDGTTQVWLGYVDGEPMSVAAAHHAANATLVEYVAALPAARGRGAGSAVTWAATLSQPDAPAMLLASDDGRPVYERMGYHALIRWSAWLRPASLDRSVELVETMPADLDKLDHRRRMGRWRDDRPRRGG